MRIPYQKQYKRVNCQLLGILHRNTICFPHCPSCFVKLTTTESKTSRCPPSPTPSLPFCYKENDNSEFTMSSSPPIHSQCLHKVLVCSRCRYSCEENQAPYRYCISVLIRIAAVVQLVTVFGNSWDSLIGTDANVKTNVSCNLILTTLEKKLLHRYFHLDQKLIADSSSHLGKNLTFFNQLQDVNVTSYFETDPSYLLHYSSCKSSHKSDIHSDADVFNEFDPLIFNHHWWVSSFKESEIRNNPWLGFTDTLNSSILEARETWSLTTEDNIENDLILNLAELTSQLSISSLISDSTSGVYSPQFVASPVRESLDHGQLVPESCKETDPKKDSIPLLQEDFAIDDDPEIVDLLTQFEHVAINSTRKNDYNEFNERKDTSIDFLIEDAIDLDNFL
ncbi:hypothetical protein BKA69DRAFT_284513 [Paraphysoderma sedebokerense]|nr:hypothetical protein BKA69DRAFT_284513 [Paraphysoderma sedebokerense]